MNRSVVLEDVEARQLIEQRPQEETEPSEVSLKIDTGALAARRMIDRQIDAASNPREQLQLASRTGPPQRSSPTIMPDAPKPPASYLIGRADRIVTMWLEQALADTGLTINEYTALTVIAARPGISGARLARQSLVTPQAIHKVVKTLERSALIERASPPEGGRVLEATITPKGRALIDSCSQRVAEAEDHAFAGIDADERQSLIGVLRAMSNPNSITGE